jgi:flagellar protein FliO/FliZ
MEIEYLKYVFALLAVVGLIVALPALARRFINLQDFSQKFSQRFSGPARSKSRLAVVETLTLDARHKLTLVRRDGVEHLLLLGPTGETVVETGIIRPAGHLQAAPLQAAHLQAAVASGSTAAAAPLGGSKVSSMSALSARREDRP